MSKVFNRKLFFNRGGPVVSSRGVGITSGLVPSYAHGGLHEEDKLDKYNTTLEELRAMNVVPERKPFSKFDAATPALLNLFSGLMSGKSYQGGLGGALDIAGQAVGSSTPLFAEAIKAKKEYDSVDPEATIKNIALGEAFKKDDPRYEYKVSGDNLIKIDKFGKEEPVVTPLPKEKEVFKLQGEPNTVFGNFSEPGTNNIVSGVYAQEFVYEDGKVEYKIGDQTYPNYEPKEKPSNMEAPTIYDKNYVDPEGIHMIQQYISSDKGFTEHGTPFPKFEKKGEAQWKYSTTKDQKVIRNGVEYTKHFAVYNKEGVTEPKLEEMFESETLVDGKKRASSGNVVFKEGNLAGQSFGAVEFNDGSVSYYAGVDAEGADDNGLVKATGAFEFFTSSVAASSKDNLFGTKDMEKAALDVASASQTLAAGANLLNQVNELGTNVNTLNRAILDKGGKFLVQIPGFGSTLKEGLFDIFDADPDELQKFITNARIFVAQNISTITGEGSSRVSEPERFLANQALQLLETMTDSQSAVSAIKASMASTYIQSHRQQIVAGLEDIKLNDTSTTKNTFELPNGNIINEDTAKYHAKVLRSNYGFTDKEIANLLLQMSTMENSGLNALSQITDSHQMYYKNNKDGIQKQFYALSGKEN